MKLFKEKCNTYFVYFNMKPIAKQVWICVVSIVRTFDPGVCNHQP